MNQKRIIIGIMICIISSITLGIILINQDLKNFFMPVNEINNIVDFHQCKEGDFVNVKVTKAYETEYYYSENRKRSSKILRYRTKWICSNCSNRKYRSTKNNR